MRIRTLVVLLVAMPCFSIATTAMEINAVDSVGERSYELPEAQIEAAKPVMGLKTANPLYQIDASMVNKVGITDLADAMHRLPGVNLRDYGGAGGLKTVSVRGMGAPHTTVCYDGMPVTDAQNGAIDLSRFSLNNTATLSLVIGDNDDIFIPAKTASAPALLNLTTPLLDPLQGTALSVQLKAGAFGLINPYLSISQRLCRNLTVNAIGEFTHARNNYPFKWENGKSVTIERRENNTMNSGHAELNLQWVKPSGFALTVKGYYYDNRRELPGPVLYYNINASRQHLTERNVFGQATFTTPANRNWKVKVGAKYNRSITLYTPDTDTDTDLGRENYYQSEIYATASALFTPHPDWTFDYSADYIYNDLASNLATDKRPYRHSILQSITGKWTLRRLTFTARLIGSIYLIGTADKTADPGRNHRRLSPSVSLSLRLLNNGLLYGRLGYKNIFRMPTFNEAFFNHFGSPDLKPETTEQFNAGLTFQAPSLGSLRLLCITADAYFNRVKDRIVAIPYNMFIWTVTNVAAVKNTGIDATLAAEITLARRHSLSFTANYSFQRAKIDVDRDNIIYNKQVAYTPLHSGAFSASWQNPWVNLTLHGQGMSSRWASNYNTPESFVKGYFEYGAAAWREWTLHRCTLELRLDLINILDTQYYIVARYPMPGRAWQLTFKFNY